MSVCVIVFMLMAVIATIGFAAAFVMRMGMRCTVGMGMRMRVLMLVVVIATIGFAAALSMFVRMLGAVCMGMGMGMLCVSHD